MHVNVEIVEKSIIARVALRFIKGFRKIEFLETNFAGSRSRFLGWIGFRVFFFVLFVLVFLLKFSIFHHLNYKNIITR